MHIYPCKYFNYTCMYTYAHYVNIIQLLFSPVQHMSHFIYVHFFTGLKSFHLLSVVNNQCLYPIWNLGYFMVKK